MSIVIQQGLVTKDYTWLIAAVQSWSHRSDIAAQVPDFVLLAEERMSADLDARGLDSTTTVTATAGINAATLAPEVIEIRSVAIDTNPPLIYLSPDSLRQKYSQGEVGVPRYYSVVGDQLYLGPIPDSAYTLTLTASMTLPALTIVGNNWLIRRNPSLYLAATMVEAMLWLRDTDGQALWEGKYQSALKTANSTNNTPTTLSVRSDTMTP